MNVHIHIWDVLWDSIRSDPYITKVRGSTWGKLTKHFSFFLPNKFWHQHFVEKESLISLKFMRTCNSYYRSFLPAQGMRPSVVTAGTLIWIKMAFECKLMKSQYRVTKFASCWSPWCHKSRKLSSSWAIQNCYTDFYESNRQWFLSSWCLRLLPWWLKLRIGSVFQVIEHRDGFHPGTALQLVKDYDVVLDASDNAPTRYLISDACCVLGKPLVSGAAIGTDGQLNVYCHNKGRTSWSLHTGIILYYIILYYIILYYIILYYIILYYIIL